MRFRRIIELRAGGVGKAELLTRLAQQSVSLNDYARALFADEEFTTSGEGRTVGLAVVSLTDIGLPQGGVFDDILLHAARVGLEPCPLEIAPHVRLAYLDQAEGPYLTVASLPLRPDPSAPRGFYLRRLEGGLWLRGFVAGPEVGYAPDFSDFVFACPQR